MIIPAWPAFPTLSRALRYQSASQRLTTRDEQTIASLDGDASLSLRQEEPAFVTTSRMSAFLTSLIERYRQHPPRQLALLASRHGSNDAAMVKQQDERMVTVAAPESVQLRLQELAALEIQGKHLTVRTNWA